jgi:hypothetical protein
MLKAATANTNTADAMIKMGATFMMISNRQSEIENVCNLNRNITIY